jgi:Helix-turn-helix of DDE superfamily endonuclease
VRKPGGGCKGKLPTMAEKLLFVLYYYKTYPTFDVLGTQFDMVRSKANRHYRE